MIEESSVECGRSYLHTVRRNGREYCYSRIPDGKGGFISRRLSDDPIAAAAQCARLQDGIEEIEEKYLRELFYRSRQRAKDRSWDHDLDRSMLLALLRKGKFRCAVSGLRFSMKVHNDGGAFSRPFAPSLDRIDSSRGYTADNVRIVCRIVNFGANKWGMDALLTMAEALAKAHSKNEFGK